MIDERNLMANSFESSSFESSMGGGQTNYTRVPTPSHDSKKTILIILGIIAAIVCIIGVAAAIILNQPKTKIARSFAKTLTDGGYLVKDLDSKLRVTNTMTCKVDYTLKQSGDEMGATIEMAFDDREKQMSGNVSLPGTGNCKFIVRITSEDLRIKLPDWDDHVFVYNYKGTKSGILKDLLGSSGLAELDNSLDKLYNSTLTGGKKDSELDSAYKDFYDRIECKKAASLEFEVDGKNRICPGYDLIITKSNLTSLLNSLESYYGIDSDSYSELLPNNVNSYIEIINTLKDEIANIDSITLHVYLYKGKLAAIQVPLLGSDDSIQIAFKGGDYRLQNIIVSQTGNGTELMNLNGSRTGKEENWKIFIAGEETCTASYNHDSGDYKVKIGDEETGYSISGNFQSTMNDYTFTFRFSDNESGDSFTFRGFMYRGAQINELSGNEFDIGNASTGAVMKLDLFRHLLGGLY